MGIVATSTAPRRVKAWYAVRVFEKPWRNGHEFYDELNGLNWRWLSPDGVMPEARLAGEKPTDEFTAEIRSHVRRRC